MGVVVGKGSGGSNGNGDGTVTTARGTKKEALGVNGST